MTEVVTIAPWNPWPLVFPLLVLIAGAVVIVIGVSRKKSRLIELGVFVAVGGVIAGGLMTWGLSQAWDAEARRSVLDGYGYTETEFTTDGDRSGDQPVLEFVGVLDGQHGELGELRHVSGDRWELVEF
ncbi:hypothetical protein [Agromyces lapidis]|uniref:DUF4190 domain-containing protein n=1 Tax=Agromyces lapidis TaxID=279574 RepID=A0ABV5SMI6_9MICO|nr:hypothetical protein [Agromyces lapidis]